jgi:hypothetical protein
VRTSRSGGHTQFRVVRTSAPGVRITRIAPLPPIASAGTTAHRCGSSVRRTDRNAISAHPNPNPMRRAPVIVASAPPAKTTRASTSAATAPAATEAMIEPLAVRRVALT